ncbi:MAG: DUF192 domain-containing protein [Planctomycetes bacterium]|nr:DUF192 domain-containing protein [Planctomycetota bacterium]
MKELKMVERNTGRVLLGNVKAAIGPVERFTGLMGRKSLKAETGMYFPHCSSIHMFFMRFAIDAVYFDREYRIKKIVSYLKPWRLSWCPGGDSVLEVPAGWCEEIGLEVGTRVEFQEKKKSD